MQCGTIQERYKEQKILDHFSDSIAIYCEIIAIFEKKKKATILKKSKKSRFSKINLALIFDFEKAILMSKAILEALKVDVY